MDTANIDCKTLLSFIYHSYKREKKNIVESLDKSGWKVLNHEKDHLYDGIAFVNHDLKTVTIAHRGVDFKTGIIDDLYNVWQVLCGGVPNKFNHTQQYIDSLLETHPAVKEYSFVNTGHSLGSVLSTLSTTYLTSKEIKAESINFEGIGSGYVLDAFIQGEGLNVTSNQLNVQTFNAPPSYINNHHLEVGQVHTYGDLGVKYTGIEWVDSLISPITNHLFYNIHHYADFSAQ